MIFVCPICKGPLETGVDYRCPPCRRTYPVVCGIPDFRLHPDPYIPIEADWKKGERLLRASEGRSFEELLAYYYSITPEVPPDLARKYLLHSKEQVNVAGAILRSAGIASNGRAGRALLDIGCSTGGLLLASRSAYRAQVGLDVAFRWLVVARVRMTEAGFDPTLVCANAEALPFTATSFDLVTMIDVIEHLRDPKVAVEEMHRVCVPGARILCETNNRYAPLPDPQVGVWGVGYLPRRMQPKYVAARRSGIHVYQVRMCGAGELRRTFRGAGFEQIHSAPAPLFAPHIEGSGIKTALAGYNAACRWPGVRNVLNGIGPRLRLTATRAPEARRVTA